MHVIETDPLFDEARAHALLAAVRQGGPYPLYASETSAGGLSGGLPERYDSARNYVLTGGLRAANEPIEHLIRRTSYFRATLARRGGDGSGFGLMFEHPALRAAVERLCGQGIVVPAIVYLNAMVPGQELAVHTDVPDFLGADRRTIPQWLLVVMRHSRLFEGERLRIATSISYVGAAVGGQLVYHPGGPAAPPATFSAAHNKAITLDTDTIYHGVSMVGPAGAPPPDVGPGAQLTGTADAWNIIDHAGDTTMRCGIDDVRISISTKVYWFRDDEAVRRWQHNDTPLTPAVIAGRLLGDLRSRGALRADESPRLSEIADLLIDTYEHYPR